MLQNAGFGTILGGAGGPRAGPIYISFVWKGLLVTVCVVESLSPESLPPAVEVSLLAFSGGAAFCPRVFLVERLLQGRRRQARDYTFQSLGREVSLSGSFLVDSFHEFFGTGSLSLSH